MPASTRASRAKAREEEEGGVAEGRAGPAQEVDEEEQVPKSGAKKKRKSDKRKKKEEELRSRNLGVGMKISIDAGRDGTGASGPNKKIAFGDDEEFDEPPEDDFIGGDEANDEGVSKERGGEHDDDGDDDDDDAVEEVKASAAKEVALRQREAERETAREEAKLHKKKKKKRKRRVVEKKEIPSGEDMEEIGDEEGSEDDELDEDFLAMVDSERQSELILQKLKKKAEKRRKLQGGEKLGRHTTFVSDGGDGRPNDPIQADHNIEVVVLPPGGGEDQDDGGIGIKSLQTSSALGTEPSKAALIFSRSRLTGGDVGRGKRVKTKKGRPAKMEGWKRSRKMTHLQGRARAGLAAANFVRKTK